MEIKRYSCTHPFIPHRLAALKAWWQSGEAEAILARVDSKCQTINVQIQAVGLQGLATGEDLVDPYVKAYQRHRLLGVTPTKGSVQGHIWKNIGWSSFSCLSGEPVFLEVWDEDYGWLPDGLLGIFVIHPNENRTSYQTSITWDVDKRTGITRTGIGAVKLSLATEPKEE